MAISRRSLLRGLGPAVAFPYLLRSKPAHAAPTLQLLGGPIELGADQPGGKRGISLAALTGGPYAACWINTRSATDVRGFVQKFARNGSALSDPIQLGGGSLTDGIPTFNVSAVSFPNDSLLIFFSAEQNGMANNFDIYVQRMSSLFKKSGSPKPVNTTLSGAQTGVLATLLADGNVQVAWESAAMDFSSSTIRGRIMEPDGDPLTSERTLIKNPQGYNTPRALAPLPDGGAILSYHEQQAVWTKALQEITPLGKPGATKSFPSVDPSRYFGSIGLLNCDPVDATDFAFFFKVPASGNKAKAQQYEINFDSISHMSDLMALPTDPVYTGAPRIVPVDLDGIGYAVGFWRTESMTQNTMTVILNRLSDGTFLRKVAAGFEKTSLTIDSAVEIDLGATDRAEVVVGTSNGDNATDERAFIWRYGLKTLAP